MEWGSVGDAVWLVLRRDLLDDLHLAEVDDTDLVLVPVRGVDLVALVDVRETFDSGNARNRSHDGVALELDHVEDPGGEMRGKQITTLVVDGEVIETLTCRSRQINGRDLLQRRAAQCW